MIDVRVHQAGPTARRLLAAVTMIGSGVTVGAGAGASSSPATRIPASRSAAAVASELGTAAAASSGRAANSSMKNAAVLPVPTPTTPPGSRYASAALATVRFCSSLITEGSCPLRDPA